VCIGTVTTDSGLFLFAHSEAELVQTCVHILPIRQLYEHSRRVPVAIQREMDSVLMGPQLYEDFSGLSAVKRGSFGSPVVNYTRNNIKFNRFDRTRNSFKAFVLGTAENLVKMFL
jgi:hypothetical protein